MPINYRRYPPDWKTRMRPAILQRAGHCCEFCGIANYAYQPDTGSRVVLTIAHLDHDEDNHAVALDRLAALCQRCHLRYDAPEKARRRATKRA